MKKFFLAFVMSILLATTLQAATVAKVDGANGTILFYDVQCTGTPYFQWVMNDLKGKRVYSGCWFQYGKTIIILEQKGEVITLPIENLDMDPTT